MPTTFNLRSCIFLLTALTSTQSQSLQAFSVQASGSAPKAAQAAPVIEVLTDTEGVNFNSYLGAVYRAVRDKWRENMPPSVQSGQQGKNCVQVRIMQDGTVPEEFLKLVFRSEKKDLDEASLQALRKAAPFNHLPDKFSKPFIELRVIFYYNLAHEAPS
jgi:outer membrane biosynthesis protein TonB